MQDVVLFEELSAGDKVIGVATLNSEKSLNALSLAMAEKLLPQLKKWADDDKVACVWLQGSGEKAFCAGGDISGMGGRSRDPDLPPPTPEDSQRRSSSNRRP